MSGVKLEDAAGQVLMTRRPRAAAKTAKQLRQFAGCRMSPCMLLRLVWMQGGQPQPAPLASVVNEGDLNFSCPMSLGRI